MTGKSRGRFVWHDLLTTDPPRAIDFYARVAGWGTSPWQGPTPYTMWTNKTVPVGGVTKVAPGQPPHWLSHISTPDADATVRRVGALGGRTVVPAIDIPSVGRYAVLTDPQGAEFAIFRPQNARSSSIDPPRRGDFSWHELATHDVPAAFRFYEEIFGWNRTTVMDMGEAGEYQMFGVDGVELGGMYRKPAEMTGPPAWLPYVMVDDVQRAAEITKDRGGQVVNGPMEVPGGDWIAVGIDPQGAFFAVHAKKKG